MKSKHKWQDVFLPVFPKTFLQAIQSITQKATDSLHGCTSQNIPSFSRIQTRNLCNLFRLWWQLKWWLQLWRALCASQESDIGKPALVVTWLEVEWQLRCHGDQTHFPSCCCSRPSVDQTTWQGGSWCAGLTSRQAWPAHRGRWGWEGAFTWCSFGCSWSSDSQRLLLKNNLSFILSTF